MTVDWFNEAIGEDICLREFLAENDMNDEKRFLDCLLTSSGKRAKFFSLLLNTENDQKNHQYPTRVEKTLLAIYKNANPFTFQTLIHFVSDSVGAWAISRITKVERDPCSASHQRLLKILLVYNCSSARANDSGTELERNLASRLIENSSGTNISFDVQLLSLQLISSIADRNPDFLLILRDLPNISDFHRFLVSSLSTLQELDDISNVLLYLLVLFQLVDGAELESKLFVPKNINQALLLILFCLSKDHEQEEDPNTNSLHCAFRLLTKFVRNSSLKSVLLTEEKDIFAEILKSLRLPESTCRLKVTHILEIVSALIEENVDLEFLFDNVDLFDGLLYWLNDDFTCSRVMEFLRFCEKKKVPIKWNPIIADIMAIICDSESRIMFQVNAELPGPWLIEEMIELLYCLLPNGASSFADLAPFLITLINESFGLAANAVPFVFNYLRLLHLLDQDIDLVPFADRLKATISKDDSNLAVVIEEMIKTKSISNALYQRLNEIFAVKKRSQNDQLEQALCDSLPHLKNLVACIERNKS